MVKARTRIVKQMDIQPEMHIAMPRLKCVNINNASLIETAGRQARKSAYRNRRFITVMVCAVMSIFGTLALPAYGNNATKVGNKQGPERAWVEEASRLVQLAGTSNADAVQYKRDVLASRKHLRALMPPGPNYYSGGSNNPPSPRQQLLSSMVVLDALLKSASACQTVGRIVCPASLMSQLHATLASVRSNLDAYEATLATTSSGTRSHDRNP